MSPSLVYQGDFSDPLPEGFEPIYMHLLEEDHSNKVVDEDTELDNILIQASQLYEASASMRVERQGDVETGNKVSPAIVKHRFFSPKSASEVESVFNSAISNKTKQNTE